VSALETAAKRLLGAAEAAADGGDPGWLQAHRREAREAFAERGLPSTREEEWRYTSLAPLGELELGPARAAELGRDDLEALASPLFACSLFAFAGGRAVPELSSAPGLPGGARCDSLAALFADGASDVAARLGRHVDLKAHPFAALNSASLVDGAAVHGPRGDRLEQPLHLVFASAGRGEASHPRTLVVAEAGSEMIVVQDHVSLGDEPGFTNSVTEVHVGAGAKVHLVVLQREHAEQVHVANLQVRQERDSHFSSHTLSLSGRLVRNDLGCLLAGEGAFASLDGLTVAGGESVFDHHTEVDHAVAHCSSAELYKGVLGGAARGVFRGRVIVRPGAQKTDASQSNPNLVIGAGAEVDTKPQLEIYADDVKCSHGSTIGRLDENALFYLRARALSEARAREMLTRAFALEVLERLPGQGLSEGLDEAVGECLRRVGASS